MTSFDFDMRTRIVFGPGRLGELGILSKQLGASRVLLVSDPGIVAAGHAARAIESLQREQLTVRLFDQVDENPTTAHVADGVAAAVEFSPDLIVGFGGGSSMDCAKGINFVHTNGGRMHDYWGIGKTTRPMLPMIGVPTTAGTGSETQSFALISDAETHVKMACGDKRAAFRVALLDPELTLTQPPRVTALTGMDALSHALETYVTKRRNPASVAFSLEAWRLLSKTFERVLSQPDDLEARFGVGKMLLEHVSPNQGLVWLNSVLSYDADHVAARELLARYYEDHRAENPEYVPLAELHRRRLAEIAAKR